MAVCTTLEEEKLNGRVQERKLIVQKIAFDHETVKNIVEDNKTRLFAKLGFFKPKQEDVECESVQLFYEPFISAKANYFLDYYKTKTYTIRIDEDVREVIAFGQTLKPMAIKDEGILKRPYRVITFEAQERAIHKAATCMALNKAGREIDPAGLPPSPTEPEPEKALTENNDRVRELKVSPDIILDMILRRTVERPPDVTRIAKEMFEVTEYAVLCTPIYEARCRQLRTGEIKIIPISAVTGRMISL